MNASRIKKLLCVALTATMMMATALTASASSQQGGGGSSSVSSWAGHVQASSVASNATVKVAGTNVQTTVAGCYAAKKVEGCAVTTADVATALGLTGSQKAVITVLDTDQKKSNKAMDSINAAIKAINGGDVAAVLNVDLSATSKGKKVVLSNGSVAMAVGLPKAADASKAYAVICVQPGGTVTVLEDQDANPKTVTFEVKAGLGTYAIVAK